MSFSVLVLLIALIFAILSAIPVTARFPLLALSVILLCLLFLFPRLH